MPGAHFSSTYTKRGMTQSRRPGPPVVERRPEHTGLQGSRGASTGPGPLSARDCCLRKVCLQPFPWLPGLLPPPRGTQGPSLMGKGLPDFKESPEGCLGGSLVKRLPLAQVMFPGSWDRAPHRAPCSTGSLLLPLPLPLLVFPLSLSLSLSLSIKINK